MITLETSGSFDNTLKFLKRMQDLDKTLAGSFDNFGDRGVTALAKATPKDSGVAARSWDYRIFRDSTGITIEWFNTDNEGGVNVAIILQYGHGTGTGGYVEGIDYINPAMRPIFDKIADEVWKKVNE